MTLDRLLAIADLGLELVYRGHGDQVVTGVHPVEIEGPGRWILPGYIVLTTGVALVDDSDRQRAFVRSLAAAGACAVGYAIGIVTDVPPGAVISECKRQGLSLFTVPPEVPFRELAAVLYRETGNARDLDFTRAVAMQDYLLAALNHEQPRDELVRRLWQLIRHPIAVVDECGVILSSAGATEDSGQFDRVVESRAGESRVGEGLVLVRDIAAGRPLPTRIMVYLDAAKDTGLVENLLAFAARALKMIVVAQRMIDEGRRRRSADICRALLRSDYPKTPELLNDVTASGLPRGARISVALFEPRTGASTIDPAKFALAVYDVMDRTGLPYLAMADEHGCHVIAPADTLEDRLNEVLRSPGADVRVCISSASADLERIPQLAVEARLTSKRTPSSGDGPASVVKFQNESPIDVFLAYVPTLLRTGLSRILDPLNDNPSLIETLDVYLRLRRDIAATATQLCVHPNTVRYRLTRVETLVGRSLEDTETLLAIYVALHERAAR